MGTWCLEERIGNLIPNQDLEVVNLFRPSLSPMGSSQLTQDLLPHLKDRRPIRVVSRVHKLAVVKPLGRNLLNHVLGKRSPIIISALPFFGRRITGWETALTKLKMYG